MNQTVTNSSNTSLSESLSIDIIKQTLDDLEKKYSPSSFITPKTPIEYITFVPDEKTRQYPRSESRIHTVLRFEHIYTLGELLEHYKNHNNTISVKRIGPISSSFIINYIQAYEKQQHSPSEQSILIDQQMALTNDKKSIDIIISQLEPQESKDNYLVAQILEEFKKMKTEEDKEKLQILIHTFETQDLLERAKKIQTILKDREDIVYDLFKKSLTIRTGASYEDQCK